MKPRGLAALCVFLVGFSPLAQAETWPSFDLANAAAYSTAIVVVEEGKVVDVWKGTPPSDLLVPDPDDQPLDVEYSFTVVENLDDELAARDLVRVATVSGRRLVLFVVPQSDKAETFADQRAFRTWGLGKDQAYTTVWIEEHQAFARQQSLNPGGATMSPLEQRIFTERDLKLAVKDILRLQAEIDQALSAEEPRQQAARLLEVLEPDNFRSSQMVQQVLGERRLNMWPAARPLLESPEYLPLHPLLIRIAYNYVRPEDRPSLLAATRKIVAEEDEFTAALAKAGKTINDEKPPYNYRVWRKLAAEWVLESSK